MSLLSAGRQIANTNDKAFGRGLFVVDPEQAEHKARKQNQYQEQLRVQMQEAKRRKQEQKRKEMEEDLKLEQKIKQEINREKENKNEKPGHKNDKNVTQPPQQPQLNKADASRVEYKERRREESSPNYKFDFRVNTETTRPENPFSPKRFDIIQAEQERYYDQSNANRLRGMRQALDQKMTEVFKKIKQSQNLEIDKEVDLIRKKIATSNTSYESQNPPQVQLEGQYSHFYRIPKKQNFYAEPQVKNLEYDAVSYQKKRQRALQNDVKPVAQQKLQASRRNSSRESKEGTKEQLWGMQKGRKNYLGNRQALDYQINSTMQKIDNMLG